MKVLYLDLCALKRPFDRIESDRAQLEALAVASILEAFQKGDVRIVSSGILELENSRNPDTSRRDAVQDILALFQRAGRVDATMESGARDIQALGFQPIDALHLASAVGAGCELFVTCDDGILHRARRCSGDLLKVRVVDPLEALTRLRTEEA
jgi:hypothetical protein